MHNFFLFLIKNKAKFSDQRSDAKLLITDFGLAHQSETVDEPMSETCGTPEYIGLVLNRFIIKAMYIIFMIGIIFFILSSLSNI